ncbi:MAG: hypothetical protein AB7J35_11000 [Dehalococcoidia bacterium]
MARTSYERKMSSEESREGYVLVEKAALSFFPPIGETFELEEPSGRRAASVEARHCECRGPEKPHEHYFIRAAGLERGSRWKFERAGDGYRLSSLAG